MLKMWEGPTLPGGRVGAGLEKTGKKMAKKKTNKKTNGKSANPNLGNPQEHIEGFLQHLELQEQSSAKMTQNAHLDLQELISAKITLTKPLIPNMATLNAVLPPCL